MSDDLVKRLRARKFFWLNGSRWNMGTEPDQDCAEAADEIERLQRVERHWLEFEEARQRAIAQRVEPMLDTPLGHTHTADTGPFKNIELDGA